MQQSTNNWINVWSAWAEQKGHDKSIEGYEPVALNKILEHFYATARKKNGGDYEPDSLRVMVTAMDRYLADKGYKREFKIYDATVAKTSLKMASSILSIFLIIISICLTFQS